VGEFRLAALEIGGDVVFGEFLDNFIDLTGRDVVPQGMGAELLPVALQVGLAGTEAGVAGFLALQQEIILATVAERPRFDFCGVQIPWHIRRGRG